MYIIITSGEKELSVTIKARNRKGYEYMESQSTIDAVQIIKK